MLFTGCGKGKDAEHKLLEDVSKEDIEENSVDQKKVSEDMINFETMQFSVNGKTYILGKTTLQEMIDDGIPFREEDLVDVDRYVDPYGSSDTFNIELGDAMSAYVYVRNYSDEKKMISDCCIYSIYTPFYRGYDNKMQNLFTFKFPNTLKEEDLRGLTIKPTHFVYSYGTLGVNTEYSYEKDLTDSFSDEYTFYFFNGKLNGIRITCRG